MFRSEPTYSQVPGSMNRDLLPEFTVMLSASAWPWPAVAAPCGPASMINWCLPSPKAIKYRPAAGNATEFDLGGSASSRSNSQAPCSPSSQRVSSRNSPATDLKSPRPNRTAPVAKGSSKCSPRLRPGSNSLPPSSSPSRGGIPARPSRHKASSIFSSVRSNSGGIVTLLRDASTAACRNKSSA